MSKEPNRNVYVGHRYVPKIMGEWDKSIDYEGLSIVTNKGTSYTSKKRVPVGIDILNEEFWVVTGNYNAQVEYYRKEVNEYKDEVDNYKTTTDTKIDEYKTTTDKKIDDYKTTTDTKIDEYKNDTDEKINSLVYFLEINISENVSDQINDFYSTIPENSTLKLKSGSYEIDKELMFNRNINIDMSDSVLTFDGEGTMITIGKENDDVREIYIHLPKIVNKTRDWNINTTGVRIVNTYMVTVENINAEGFKNGIIFDSNNNIGNSYNKYYLNWLMNNEKSITLTSKNTGWTNENIFTGGRFGWSSDTRNLITEKNVHVFIEYNDYSQNNNRFEMCSFESGAESGNEYAVYIEDGRMNYFNNCRYEGVDKIHIAKGLDIRFIGGFGLSNIVFTGQPPSRIDAIRNNSSRNESPFIFTNVTSPVNNVIEVTNNNSGLKTFSVNGTGDVTSSGLGIFTKGIRMYSSNPELDRGIYIGQGSPEGTVKANPGSIYLNTQGGNNKTLFIKESGLDETGWYSFSRPSALNSINYPPLYVGQIAVTSDNKVYVSNGLEKGDWLLIKE